MITRKILVFIALISVVFSLNNTSIYLPVPEEIPKLDVLNITPVPSVPPIPPIADCEEEYRKCLMLPQPQVCIKTDDGNTICSNKEKCEYFYKRCLNAFENFSNKSSIIKNNNTSISPTYFYYCNKDFYRCLNSTENKELCEGKLEECLKKGEVPQISPEKKEIFCKKRYSICLNETNNPEICKKEYVLCKNLQILKTTSYPIIKKNNTQEIINRSSGKSPEFCKKNVLDICLNSAKSDEGIESCKKLYERCIKYGYPLPYNDTYCKKLPNGKIICPLNVPNNYTHPIRPIPYNDTYCKKLPNGEVICPVNVPDKINNTENKTEPTNNIHKKEINKQEEKTKRKLVNNFIIKVISSFFKTIFGLFFI